MDFGVKYLLEFVCIFFKMVMGIYLEVIEKGVKVFVIFGGYGLCRVGFYGDIYRNILKFFGYDDVEFIIFDVL